MDNEQNKDDISEEDTRLFRNAMKKIIPLKKTGKILLKKKPTVKKSTRSDFYQQEKRSVLSDYQTEETVVADQQLLFVRSGLSPKQVRRLRHGKTSIDGILDLHGFDSESARQELLDFIDFAYQKNKRCIIIIHGKGHTNKPILKNKLNNWLRQLDTVLAFCTTIPKHGGTGALYVLLKSKHKINHE